MNILVTGANGQLGNEMRIIARESDDHYVFTDVNQVEGVETGFFGYYGFGGGEEDGRGAACRCYREFAPPIPMWIWLKVMRNWWRS